MNKSIYRLALTVLSVVSAMTAQAERISPELAAEIAQEFFQSYMNSKLEVVLVDYQGSYCEEPSQIDSDTGQGIPAFYIFNEAGGKGFVLIGADNSFPTVLGYSLENTWPSDVDEVPEALGLALDSYTECVERANSGETAMVDMNGWYEGPASPVVGPLLTTRWNQHYPYNKYAPEIYPAKRASERYNGHYATGCGSIAASQIINYWKKPSHPLPRTTCYRSKDYVDGAYHVNTYEVTLDPQNYYDYANFPDSIDYTPEATPWMTPEEWASKGDAIAKFIRDVAYVLNLGWTGWTGGGGSDGYAYEQALVQGFDFSLDAYTVALDGMSQLRDPLILNQMKDCLDAGMPIICRGSDTGGRGGHVFIFDGYDTNGFVHVNWGWGGSCNNWFDPGFLLTNMYDTKQSRNYNFSLDNSIVLNLHPRTETEKVHLDARQIKPYSLEICSSDKTIEEKVLRDKANKPVFYLDRNHCTLTAEFTALSFLKNLGYDYDFVFNISEESSMKTEADTVRFYGNALDTRWVSADVTCTDTLSLAGKKDGLLSFSGSVRQVLDGETGPWKNLANETHIRLQGDDVIMNPEVYDTYYHAPSCYHFCNGDNRILIHMDYMNNPQSLSAGDTLNIQVNVTGMAQNATYLNAEADTTAVLVLSHGERNDTILNNSIALNGFMRKSLEASEQTTLVDVQTIHQELTEAGHYTLTYRWPAMNVTIQDEFYVGNLTDIEKIALPADSTRPRKLLKNNKIYIHSHDNVYDTQGKKVK